MLAPVEKAFEMLFADKEFEVESVERLEELEEDEAKVGVGGSSAMMRVANQG